LAQFSGSWEGEFTLLPDVAFGSTTLTLNYEAVGWTFTSTTVFDDTGFADQSFDVSGTLGAITIEGSMSFLPAGENVLKDISHAFTYEKDWFLPPLAEDVSISYVEDKWAVEGPAYLSSSLSASMDFAGVSFGLDITHETNYVATFDICPALDHYSLSYHWKVQTTSTTGTITVDPYENYWELGAPGGCCYAKYFVTGHPEILLAEVTIKGTKGGEEVSTTLSGPFEVTQLDEPALSADTTRVFTFQQLGSTPVDGIGWIYGVLYDDGIKLGLASSTYITDYLAYLVFEEGWDFIDAIEYDPEDLSIKFLLPSYMTLTLTAEADPFKAVIVFDDVCTGIQFKEATLTLSGISLCCGVTYDAELAFNKCEGFDYLKFSVNDVFPICCGISFDIAVKFTTDAKTISLTPKFASIGEVCFELYADLESEGGENADLYLNAIRVDGWKIRCELAECNYLELVSFLSPDKADDYGYKGVFEDGEFEYAKLGFCGPGCCGGEYSVDIAVYFGSGGTLFDITRIGAEMSIPLMSNFTLDVEFSSDNNLDIGWTFTF